MPQSIRINPCADPVTPERGDLRVQVGIDPASQTELVALVRPRAATDEMRSPPATALDWSLPFSGLGGSAHSEHWQVVGPIQTPPDAAGQGRARISGELIFGEIDCVLGDDIEAITARAYAALLERAQTAGCPHLIRIWNFLPAITDGVGDAERYRRFCVGRARAIPVEPATGYAASTAIGIPYPAQHLKLAWIAARRPGVPIENPRQVSAWEYPRDYGPVAPGFSRAMLLDWLKPAVLLVSGTASVVGHASRHADVLEQLGEALANMGAVLERAAARLGTTARWSERSILRAYLRDPAHAPAVAAALRQTLGAEVPFMLLHGEICRRELAIELEAVHHF